LIDDSKPVEERLDAVLDGLYRVHRVGPAFLAKNTCVHDAKNLPIWNKVVEQPPIVRPGEIIEYVSLCAGNTGRAFDLETNHRVAEFSLKSSSLSCFPPSLQAPLIEMRYRAPYA
jgi:hypothetical protein